MADQNGTREAKGITGITVSGFKSLRNKAHIEVRPLTILAGANSSGKSSIMQSLLLMKQTLESPYNPGGTFKLDGANVHFTSATQFLTRTSAQEVAQLYIQLDVHDVYSFVGTYEMKGWDIDIIETTFQTPAGTTVLRHDIPEDELKNLMSHIVPLEGSGWHVVQEHCFLAVEGESLSNISISPGAIFKEQILQLIHVPGLRRNLERISKSAGAGPIFAGTFDNYMTSTINRWSKSGNQRLRTLRSQLEFLGLTSQIMVMQKDDVQLELLVGGLPTYIKGETRHLVSIADVGLGVSQVLPVLVALLVAEPAQLVYIEQPELHLHPKAQVALAQVLADAANRGVRVVAETHSDLLLLGIQTLVAEGKLAPDLVKLHWFDRGEDGATTITSADLDEDGAYGDWPENFADVDLEAQKRYLDASAVRNLGT